jgi:hypothetical protein
MNCKAVVVGARQDPPRHGGGRCKDTGDVLQAGGRDDSFDKIVVLSKAQVKKYFRYRASPRRTLTMTMTLATKPAGMMIGLTRS